MSQSENKVTSSSNSKRLYRKGNPLSPLERQQAHAARKKDTHKVIRVSIRNEFKAALQRICEQEGLTQSEMLEKLIGAADSLLDKNVRA
jgi:hypothetical protein